jgi:parallel beta-helix repeat protein
MANPTCGQEITEDTTLVADLTCAGGPALIVAADDVILDLGGHTISGDPKSGVDAPGIVVRGARGATVRNGTVQHFACGVEIDGGARNLVQNVTVQDNVGTQTGNYGDGIVVNESHENRIEGNTVRGNGPFSGITLLGASQHNIVRHNVVMDNNMMQSGDPNAGFQDSGIRIEGPGASHNDVDSNTITGSGADGITLLPVCLDPGSNPPCVGVPPNAHNRIINNISNGNGNVASGGGDGIRVFDVPNPLAAIHTTIADNCTNGNTEYGINFDAGSTDNKAIRNSAHGNGSYDGFDANTDPPCAANTWLENDFGTVNQVCVGGQSGQTPSPPWDPEKTKLDQAKIEARFRMNNRLPKQA